MDTIKHLFGIIINSAGKKYLRTKFFIKDGSRVFSLGNDFSVILDRYTSWGKITVPHVQSKKLDLPVIEKWDLPTGIAKTPG